MESEKSIILIQRDQKEIDGKTTWDRLELADEHEWCCDGLKNCPEIFLNEDGKFGFPQYEYKCQDSWFDYTEEIKYCPYCGKEIVVIQLETKVKVGTSYVTTDSHGWKQKMVKWDDGSVTKWGSAYLRFKAVVD